jgi:hypothetical protein
MKIGRGNRKYSEKTCPTATLSTINSTWLDPGLNPGHRGGKPATNRLNYGVALGFVYQAIWSVFIKRDYLTHILTGSIEVLDASFPVELPLLRYMWVVQRSPTASPCSSFPAAGSCHPSLSFTFILQVAGMQLIGRR